MIDQTADAITGRNLTRLRNSHDFTLDWVAHMAEMNPTRLEQIESGEAAATFSEIIKLATVLNCHLRDLWKSGRGDSLPALLPSSIDPDLVAILQAIPRATTAQKKAIKTVLGL